MRHAVLAFVAVLLAACTHVPARPVPAQCNVLCFDPCTGQDGDTGVRWEAGPSDAEAFDTLGGAVVPALAQRLRQCDVRREACVQCLRRLDEAGAIDLGPSS